MKQGDLSQWNNIEACKNLLFFAQLVNELLFDYSIPSNRISTLNSHFLCLDAINVINGIEKSGVNEGSLKPIIEELYTTLEKDITFIKHGENPLDYFMKMQPNGSYRRISKAEELNLQDAKNAVYAIQNKYFRSSWYSDMLVEDICALVKSNDPQDRNRSIIPRYKKSWFPAFTPPRTTTSFLLTRGADLQSQSPCFALRAQAIC